MAETLLVEHKDGVKTGGKILKERKTWTVTVGETIAGFYNKSMYGGPFPPGSEQTIAKFTCKNTGSKEGQIRFRADRIDADGNVVSNIMGCAWPANAGDCASMNIDEEPDACDTGKSGGCSDMWSNNPGYVRTTMPSTGGTYYYGMKTWGIDESEPSYPSPTAAIHEGRLVYPLMGIPIPQLELWQWGVIGTALAAAIGGGYYISHEWL